MTDENTTELVLTPPPADEKLTKRARPSLIAVGKNRMLCSDGRFHPDLATDYLRTNAREKWVTIHELARVFTGASTLDGRKRVRRHLFSVFNLLLGAGEFLVYEPEARGRTQAVKLLNIQSEHERQLVGPQLDRMRQRRELSAEKYERAMQIVELQHRLAAHD